MQHSLIQRMIALLLVMAYAVTGTAVLPAVLTVFAEYDGSHMVIVSKSPLGMQLTLHHRHHHFTPAISDHENAVARVLVSLCSASESGDHQFNSAELNTSTLDEQDTFAHGIKQPSKLLPATFAPLNFAALLPVRDTASLNRLREPDAPKTCLRQILASVQLLI